MEWTRPSGPIILGQGDIVYRPAGGSSMKRVHIIGIDLAKQGF